MFGPHRQKKLINQDPLGQGREDRHVLKAPQMILICSQGPGLLHSLAHACPHGNRSPGKGTRNKRWL